MIGRSPLGIAWLALAATACYPDRSVDSTTEFASVTTLYDRAAPFESITKYALPDTVLYVPKEEGKEVPAVTHDELVPAYQSIDQSKIVPLLVASVQALAAEIDLLKLQALQGNDND